MHVVIEGADRRDATRRNLDTRRKQDDDDNVANLIVANRYYCKYAR